MSFELHQRKHIEDELTKIVLSAVRALDVVRVEQKGADTPVFARIESWLFRSPRDERLPCRARPSGDRAILHCRDAA